MQRIWPIWLLLAGCAAPRGDALLPGGDSDELDAVARAFGLVRPDAWLAVAEDLDLYVPLDDACQDLAPGLADPHLYWGSRCARTATLQVGGELDLVGDSQGIMLWGDMFQAGDSQDPASLFYLDGAIELHYNGDLLIMDVTATSCGGPGRACESGDPLVDSFTVDMTCTLYPLGTFPVRYDLTVSGVVAAPDLEPTTVYGAWSIDTDVCPLEPASGSAVIGSERPHSLEFDGATSCDSCALMTVDGRPADSACLDWLP